MANRLDFSLADVLAVARIHPFYSDVQYPPDEHDIQAAREAITSSLEQPQLRTQALLWKKDLYAVIERLVHDTSPRNTYRYNVYVSMTGGGGGSKPLFLATDALENRRHRSRFGDFLRNTGVVERGDWVLTTHCAGDLYRSLDLMLEVLENAGASVLPAGNRMPPSEVVELLRAYHVNVLTGDGSQIVQVVHHISTLSSAERDKIVLDKIIYTSEALTPAQKSHIREVLGPIRLCSVLGSAEAGPYGASPADLSPSDETASHADFIIDTRMCLIEILPISCKEGDCIPSPVPEGETGIIVQTSLTRLRNPVVRYVTGDIGSVGSLPEHVQEKIPKEHQPYMRLLRLQGRDRRFSFTWDGEYFQFEEITAMMGDPSLGVLQWQVILEKMASQEASLEIRLLLAQRSERVASVKGVASIVRGFFIVYGSNQHRFKLNFVKEIKEFESSKTGQKVIKFIDRFNP